MRLSHAGVTVLKEARAKVARKWCQGVSADMYGGFCAIGAYFKYATGIVVIPLWNDMAGRRQSDVVAAFDIAIKCAEDNL